MVTKKQEQQAGRTQIVKDFKAGDISKEEASQRIRDLDRALFGGGGGSSGSVAGKSPSQIRAEANRLRQQQQQQQAQVREQMRVRQEAKATAEATKQAKVQQQKDIAIGSASKTKRWEMQNGRSVQVTNPTLKKNIGESQASFDFRAGQVGKGISASQPEAVKDFGKVKFDKRITETQELPGITLESRGLGFTVPGGQIGGGTKFIVSYTPDLTRPDVTDVTRQGTISEVPKFDTSFIFNPATSITPPSKTNGPKITVNTKDVTRQGTISPDIPQYEPPQVFDISKGPSRVDRLRDKAFTESTKGLFSLTGQAGGFAAGTAVSIGGGITFAKNIVTKPLETTGQVLQAIPKLPQAIGKVGGMLQHEGAFSAGFVFGEFLQFKAIGAAQKLAIKGFDRARTIGLKEIPAQDIIAPEFFKGQTFPQIKRGQSAGELLKEFKPKLPGEIKPAGFTSAPSPLQADDLGKILTGKGSSELPGLFQAPEISPRFLRVDKLDVGDLKISILGDTLRPSVFRITPSKFRLAPGIKETTRIIQPGKLPAIRKFFETSAKKGESIIPFIKTEKESVIPFNTLLQPTAKRFFFKFEGRRIPIQEFKTAGGTNIQGLVSAGDISSISSSSRLGGSTISVPEIVSLTNPGGSTSVSSSVIPQTKISLPISSSRVSSRRSSISSTIRSSFAQPSKSPRVSSARSSLSSIIGSSTARPSRSRSRVSRAISRPSRTSSRAGGLSSFIPKTSTGRIFSGKGRSLSNLPQGRFPVLIRRGGKFKVAGIGRSRKEALQIGKRIARTTLARSFVVPGLKQGAVPGFRIKQERVGKVFIQRSKSLFGSTLGTKGEKLEIASFRRAKKKPRKRRKK